MNKDSKVCYICARGGSTGLPGKNVKKILGKSLVGRAVETALASGCFNEVFISTDSEAIANEGKLYGGKVLFLRPPSLSGSSVGKFQVWQHALNETEKLKQKKYDLYVDIDCTNPLIEPNDIRKAISFFQKRWDEGVGIDAVFCTSVARRNPYFNLLEYNELGQLEMSKTRGNVVLARQAAPEVYEHVAGVYVLKTEYLKSAQHLLDGHTEGYLLPQDKAFDIDSEMDFLIIETILKNRCL